MSKRTTGLEAWATAVWLCFRKNYLESNHVSLRRWGINRQSNELDPAIVEKAVQFIIQRVCLQGLSGQGLNDLVLEPVGIRSPHCINPENCYLVRGDDSGIVGIDDPYTFTTITGGKAELADHVVGLTPDTKEFISDPEVANDVIRTQRCIDRKVLLTTCRLNSGEQRLVFAELGLNAGVFFI